ncbi:hypothetical protein A3Q29_18385 [Providencia stuartii]|uniref:Uncharacterized protein n=1 Tax=Providencia stuartii TaxID=588 RepID=A0A1S1HPM5_PROST|nr:hypothetical protein A3Q29_18385 [Providencia stuartii]
MRIKKITFEYFQKNILAVILILYLFISIYTLGRDFNFKVELAIILSIAVMIFCIVMRGQRNKIYYKFIYFDDNKEKKKASGFMSLLTCIGFYCFIFLNIGNSTLAIIGLIAFTS